MFTFVDSQLLFGGPVSVVDLTYTGGDRLNGERLRQELSQLNNLIVVLVGSDLDTLSSTQLYMGISLLADFAKKLRTPEDGRAPGDLVLCGNNRYLRSQTGVAVSYQQGRWLGLRHYGSSGAAISYLTHIWQKAGGGD